MSSPGAGVAAGVVGVAAATLAGGEAAEEGRAGWLFPFRVSVPRMSLRDIKARLA
eukprot:CAMPEP_0173064044 /NCGR_PEP_ID=MMETSP1102-20130122/4768_1 /TAXON_ID=49646 /ORGANISM="Geminigera sp., Strain Caron Lab Isolate" /LENGTH=54 /DNA_ID=CAMNT_0013931009 /DNA_START=1003 /DNA_END=1163 /DNA_ORIENTATION=-